MDSLTPRPAAGAIAASRPRSPALHLVRGEEGYHLFLADGSRVFDLDDGLHAAFEAALAGGGEGVARLLAACGLDGRPQIDDAPPAAPPLHALSLAVSQACNLGCSYCYAGQGSFGGPERRMDAAMAFAAVDRLVDGADAGGRVNLSFLGGEPLVNRAVLHAATRRAAERGARRGVRVDFSLTTNGTLLTEADGDLFEEHGFAVTVSLDGLAQEHDALRPFKGGAGSFERTMRNVRPLLGRQRRMQVSARVTVTPRNLRLTETLDAFIAEGFHSVGFSPLLRSSSGRDEMGPAELEAMLEGMIACGHAFERKVLAGERYPFSNAVTAMRELHKGTHRPYPCGAGAGYLAVDADGALAACHRFVGDPAGALGRLEEGVDAAGQARWLAERHVHRQEPCGTCWARYLCGGGCHHETIAAERRSCDYVRGWLHYCLQAYLRLSRARPDWFGIADPAP